MLWCEDLRDLITSIRGFIALAMATKERLPPTSLWTLSAHPRITLCPQVKNWYERKRRVFAIHGEVTASIASMQSITHQLSLFGQNDGGIVLALVFNSKMS